MGKMYKELFLWCRLLQFGKDLKDRIMDHLAALIIGEAMLPIGALQRSLLRPLREIKQ